MMLRAETEVMYSEKTLSQCHLVAMVMSVTMIEDILSELCFFVIWITGLGSVDNTHSGEGNLTINLKIKIHAKHALLFQRHLAVFLLRRCRSKNEEMKERNPLVSHDTVILFTNCLSYLEFSFHLHYLHIANVNAIRETGYS